MKPILLLFLAFLCFACALHPNVNAAPPAIPSSVNIPSRDVAIIALPTWVDDNVRVCAENFPKQEVACVKVGDLRAYLFSRQEAQ